VQDNLASLWGWLTDVAHNSQAASPLTIHSRSGDRSNWGQGSEQAIRALPFSRSFLRRVDHELPATYRAALDLLKVDPHLPPGIRAARRAQYKVITAVLRDGITDVDDCRRAVKMTPWAFAVAAEGGIRALRAALERE